MAGLSAQEPGMLLENKGQLLASCPRTSFTGLYKVIEAERGGHLALGGFESGLLSESETPGQLYNVSHGGNPVGCSAALIECCSC